LTSNEFQVIEVRGFFAHIPHMSTRTRTQHQVLNAIFAVVALPGIIDPSALPSRPEKLTPTTADAFERYIHGKEARSEQELAAGRVFLWMDGLPEPARSKSYASLRQGQIIIRRNSLCESAHCAAIPGGLIHDWVGIVFVPGISLPQAIATLQDYDRDADYYRPQVVKSKLLGQSGGDFRVFLRLRRVQITTVVLDTEYDIHYANLDAVHAYSRSYSTRIAEVESAGEPEERDKPVGDDHGFLWRLYSYWRFYQADGGVYIQCNAISLTRDVPSGLGWLIRPFVENIPAESLRLTLDATRTAVENEGQEEFMSSRKAAKSK
jgi:hypothetical protein